MLNKIVNENLIQLNVDADNWEEAVRKSAQPLVRDRKATSNYIEDMINGIKENGPYVVITKHVALPHVKIGVGALKKSVNFGIHA